MKITEQKVREVADLANLRFNDAEVQKLQSDLDGILEHIDKLNELDTTGVEPMAQVLFEAEDTATLRADLEWRRWGTKRRWPTLRNQARATSKFRGSSSADAWRLLL